MVFIEIMLAWIIVGFISSFLWQVLLKYDDQARINSLSDRIIFSFIPGPLFLIQVIFNYALLLFMGLLAAVFAAIEWVWTRFKR